MKTELEIFYEEHGREGINALAERVDVSSDYLWMCSARRAGTDKSWRVPGPKLCKKLVEKGGQGFTYHGLRPDLYPPQVLGAVAA